MVQGCAPQGAASRRALVLAALAGAALAPLARPVGVAAADRFQLQVSAGYDGYARSDDWTPVRVTPTPVQLSLTALLLALAVALLPVDIALRRLVFRRADAELWAALVKRGEAAPAEVEETLGRLRGRLDRRRAGTGVPVATAPVGARPGEAEATASAAAPVAGPAPTTGSPSSPSSSPTTPAEAGELAARLLQRRRRKGG